MIYIPGYHHKRKGSQSPFWSSNVDQLFLCPWHQTYEHLDPYGHSHPWLLHRDTRNSFQRHSHPETGPFDLELLSERMMLEDNIIHPINLLVDEFSVTSFHFCGNNIWRWISPLDLWSCWSKLHCYNHTETSQHTRCAQIQESCKNRKGNIFHLSFLLLTYQEDFDHTKI